MSQRDRAPSAELDRQRIDKWLWHARVVKTRTLAQSLVTSGRVRVNRAKVNTASASVRNGDVLTITLDRQVRVIKVAGFAERRGSATEAARLFDDLTIVESTPSSTECDGRSVETDKVAPRPSAPLKEPGGRPTKKARRDLKRLDPKAWN